MLRPPAFLYRALGLAHVLSSLRSIASITKFDGVNLIVELLSVNACPAGVMLLLRMAAAASLAASSASSNLGSPEVLRSTKMFEVRLTCEKNKDV